MTWSSLIQIDNYRPFTVSVGGIVVSIAAFQAVDPGSIPGRRILFYTKFERKAAFNSLFITKFINLLPLKSTLFINLYSQYSKLKLESQA